MTCRKNNSLQWQTDQITACVPSFRAAHRDVGGPHASATRLLGVVVEGFETGDEKSLPTVRKDVVDLGHSGADSRAEASRGGAAAGGGGGAGAGGALGGG